MFHFFINFLLPINIYSVPISTSGFRFPNLEQHLYGKACLNEGFFKQAFPALQ